MSDAATSDLTRLRIVRSYAFAPEAVFRAWTQPQALKSWFAPDASHQVSVAEVDLRVGGHYRLVMQAPGGERHSVGGEYIEIEAPRRLVFSWAWESTPERVSRVTVELRASGTGTELVLTHEQLADASARERHAQGWAACLARLAGAAV